MAKKVETLKEEYANFQARVRKAVDDYANGNILLLEMCDRVGVPYPTEKKVYTLAQRVNELEAEIATLKGSSRHEMGAGAADPQCPACHGKGSEYGQRCPCVERRLREALELPLLLHTDEQQKQRWREITGADEFTADAMCTHIRDVLRE